MGNVFRFKQFEVNQEGCAMRINTDGVLLAALANPAESSRVLDIGTGTGVIAMMMAQRFPHGVIDAVEIDVSAAITAGANFKASQFAERMQVFAADVGDYDAAYKYDLIISNPPFFLNDLKNPESRKRLARHAAGDFYGKLVLKAAELLSDAGEFWLILPIKSADMLVFIAKEAGLSMSREISICSDITKPVIRKILVFRRNVGELKRELFYIYESQGIYTDAYKSLLKDFFLAF